MKQFYSIFQLIPYCIDFCSENCLRLPARSVNDYVYAGLYYMTPFDYGQSLI